MAHSHVIKFSNELICSKNIVGAVVRTHGILKLSRTEEVFLGLTCHFIDKELSCWKISEGNNH